MTKSGRGEPTTEQVKAWIRSIYPPLIGGLDVELSWLNRNRPSWRFQDGTLEYLGPLRERLYAAVHPLFDQFLRYYPTIAEQEGRHDAALEALCSHCAVAQGALEADPSFVSAVEAADQEFRTLAPTADPDWQGASAVESKVGLAAEYVVNNVAPDAVSPVYTTRDFWLHEGARLLDFRRRHAAIFGALDASIRECTRATGSMRDVLVASRDELADLHGLPAAIVDLG